MPDANFHRTVVVLCLRAALATTHARVHTHGSVDAHVTAARGDENYQLV